MSEQFEVIFNKLQYASPVKARQILRELEVRPDELMQFCRLARRLSPVRSAALAKILSGMSNPEYLQLLKEYAAGGNEELRDVAFKALSKGNNTARKEVMLDLLKSDNAEIRVKACGAVGTEIDSEVESELIHLLSDDNVSVVRAALKVLGMSVNKSVLRRCENLLLHDNVEVRILALEILENAEGQDFAVKSIMGALENDSEDSVRVEACRVLGEKNPAVAADVLIHTLQNRDNSDHLRQQAARSVGKIPAHGGVEVLFNIIIEDRFSSRVVGECRKVLSRQNVNKVLELAEKEMNSSEVLHQFEAIRVLGMFADKVVEEFFKTKLYSSSEPIILASIIEQLAKFGDTGNWDYIIVQACKSQSVLVAYAASQAAAELLIPERLGQFVEILNCNKNSIVNEVVLKRLVNYGRDRALPESVKDIIKVYMTDEKLSVSLFAIDVAGYVENAALVSGMLSVMLDSSETMILDELTSSIMTAVGGSLKELLEIAGEAKLKAVSAILSRVNISSLEGDFADFFAYLSQHAQNKIPGAQLCLTIAASRFHQEFIRALPHVGDTELAFLLFTWSRLPQSVRDHSMFDWPLALANSRVAVRVAALRAMTADDIEKCIGDVSDVAFSDPRVEAREEAIAALRSVING